MCSRIAQHLLIVFTLATVQVSADTTFVSDHIDTSTTWTTTGSPYILTGSVTAFSSSTVTLRIQAAVEVLCATGSSLEIGYDHSSTSNFGRLVVEGTPAERVRFGALDSLAQVAWEGLNLYRDDGVAGDSIFYCDIEYATDGITATYASSVYLESCRIRYSLNNGNAFSSVPFSIYSSEIVDNGENGIQLSSGIVGASSESGCDIYNNTAFEIRYLGGNTFSALTSSKSGT